MNEESVIEPEILPDAMDFVSEAIAEGPGGEKFDFVRKIATLATLLGEDVVSAEVAATAADDAVFTKSMEYKVGDGSLSAEDASMAIVDRKASAFVATARSFISEAVETGCETIGVGIGSLFGAPTVGFAVGTAVGHFLTAPVGQLVEQGAPRIVEYAKQAWQGVKNIASSVWNAVTNFLFA